MPCYHCGEPYFSAAAMESREMLFRASLLDPITLEEVRFLGLWPADFVDEFRASWDQIAATNPAETRVFCAADHVDALLGPSPK